MGVTKKRQYVRLSGVAPDIAIVPFDHKIDTLYRAVLERVFNVKNVPHKTGSNLEFSSPPKPVATAFTPGGVMENTRASLFKLLPTTAPISHQQFVESYKGRKREVYQRALEELQLGTTTTQEDAEVKVFIKHEKTDRTSKRDPVPRVISPRNPKFNVRLGRYLKPIEERIFKSLGKLFGHRTVMKGMDVVQTAKVMKEKWDMFSQPVAVGLDASRFDQHVSLDALKWEHDVYLHCFRQKKHKERLQRILACQLNNKCVGYAEDGVLRYTTEGTRMSGDMNTSLGNCVLMCSMIHAYLADRGIKGQLANNGDDCVVFMEKDDLGKFSTGLFDWFWNMGFNMAIEAPVYEFSRIEFCQCKPVFDGSDWRMCRNPTTAIAKDAVLLHSNVSSNFFRLWLNAIGEGGLSLAGGMPIFQSFYQMCVRHGVTSYRSKNSKVGAVKMVSTEMMPWFMRETGMRGSHKATTVTDVARASFWEAYDITPCEQIILEEYYDKLTMGDFAVEWVPRDLPF